MNVRHSIPLFSQLSCVWHHWSDLMNADHYSVGAAGHVVAGWTSERTERLVPKKLRQAHLSQHGAPCWRCGPQQKHKVSSKTSQNCRKCQNEMMFNRICEIFIPKRWQVNVVIFNWMIEKWKKIVRGLWEPTNIWSFMIFQLKHYFSLLLNNKSLSSCLLVNLEYPRVHPMGSDPHPLRQSLQNLEKVNLKKDACIFLTLAEESLLFIADFVLLLFSRICGHVHLWEQWTGGP